MRRKIVAALDIGSENTKVMVCDRRRGERQPRVLGVGIAPSEGVRKGIISDIEDAEKGVKRALQLAEKMSGLPVKNVYLSIGGNEVEGAILKGVAAVSRADSEISKYDMQRAIDTAASDLRSLSNKELLHKIPIIFKIDNDIETKDPAGMSGSRLEARILAVTSIKQHIKNLVKCVESAGVSVDNIIAGPLAASRAVMDSQQKEVGAALLDIGAATSSVAVFEEGSPISLEIFPLGSFNITKDIAIFLKSSLEDAEKHKLVYGRSNRRQDKELKKVIDARLADIFEALEGHLKKIGRERLLASGIILSGGGANLSDLAEYSKEYLHLPVEVGVVSCLSVPDERLASPQWAVAAGLCLLALDEQDGSRTIGLPSAPSFVTGFIGKWLRAFLP